MIPKPRDRKALRTKPGVALDVAAIIGMLDAVAFDNEAMLEADEIDDVDTDGNLSSPLGQLQPPISKKTPKRFFSVSLVGT